MNYLFKNSDYEYSYNRIAETILHLFLLEPRTTNYVPHVEFTCTFILKTLAKGISAKIKEQYKSTTFYLYTKTVLMYSMCIQM